MYGLDMWPPLLLAKCMMPTDPTSPWPSGGFGDSTVREPPSERLATSSSGGSGADAAAATAAASAAAAAAAAAAEEERRPRLCACWCLGWAEIHIRQPTGELNKIYIASCSCIILPHETKAFVQGL